MGLSRMRLWPNWQEWLISAAIVLVLGGASMTALLRYTSTEEQTVTGLLFDGDRWVSGHTLRVGLPTCSSPVARGHTGKTGRFELRWTYQRDWAHRIGIATPTVVLCDETKDGWTPLWRITHAQRFNQASLQCSLSDDRFSPRIYTPNAATVPNDWDGETQHCAALVRWGEHVMVTPHWKTPHESPAGLSPDTP